MPRRLGHNLLFLIRWPFFLMAQGMTLEQVPKSLDVSMVKCGILQWNLLGMNA